MPLAAHNAVHCRPCRAVLQSCMRSTVVPLMCTGMAAKKISVSALHVKKGFARGDGDKCSLNTNSVQMCSFQTLSYKVLFELGAQRQLGPFFTLVMSLCAPKM